MKDGKSSNRDDDGNYWVTRVFRTPQDSGSFMPGTLDGAPTVAKHFTGETPGSINSMIVDARLVGLSVGSIATMRSNTLQHPIGGSQFEFQEPETNVVGGESCLRIYGSRNEGRDEVTYWLNPRQGGEIVRALFQVHPGEKSTRSYLGEFTVQLKEWSNGFWFPEVRVLKEYSNHRLTSVETITVVKAEFNVEIPSEEFTLAGLGVPINWVVQVESPEPPRLLHGTWDGREVVPHLQKEVAKQAAHEAGVATQPVSWYRIVFLWLNLLVLLLVIAYWIRSHFRKVGSS
ncbi:MAG: hypothetical protein R3C01_14560 [Planctomycetaceae bacterium]